MNKLSCRKYAPHGPIVRTDTCRQRVLIRYILQKHNFKKLPNIAGMGTKTASPQWQTTTEGGNKRRVFSFPIEKTRHERIEGYRVTMKIQSPFASRHKRRINSNLHNSLPNCDGVVKSRIIR